jgi:hypothetical protein
MADFIRNFILASLAAITIMILSILFNIARSFLSDKTTISIKSLLDISWLWEYKYYLAFIFVIGVAYFGSSMLMTQFSSNLSLGRHTATFTFLVFLIWSTLFIPINIFVYNVWRKEAIPELSDRFWLYVSVIIILNLAVAYFASQAIDRLQELGQL